jgi:hypothetical protein
MHNEENHNIIFFNKYYSDKKSWKARWIGHIAHTAKMTRLRLQKFEKER